MKNSNDIANQIGAQIPDHKWKLIKVDGYIRTYEADLGDGVTIEKREYAFEDELLRQNAWEREESEHKKFASDSDPVGTKVASIPLNIFYRDFAKRLKEGDEDFTKWWLNHEDNKPFRTFRGKL